MNELATFAGGCFWGMEEAFRKIPGVIKTAVGYMGGHTDSPTYQDVRTGETGHAEVVQVTYNPEQVSYEDLLDIFWRIHNPTELNRQGVDVGTQYRSAIYYHNEEQCLLAEKTRAELDASDEFQEPVVTVIEPVVTFFEAEDYHQKYFMRTGYPSCHILRPKRK